jgi:hypothetical protein
LKTSSAVGDPAHAHFRDLLPIEKPGMPFSIMKVVIALQPFSPSPVLA